MWVGSSYKVSGEEKYFTLKVNVYGNDGVVVEVNGISLDKSSETIKLASTTQLNATITPASPSDKTITWTSSNPKIASVSNTGLVEAKGIGNATITATTSNGKSASANIKIEANNTNIISATLYNETTCPTGKEETCEMTTCLVNGTCPAGTAISYKVNDTTIQDFYVLKDNGSTLTLISTNGVTARVPWNESGSNVDGPITANAALTDATSGWNTTARMVTYDEAVSMGCSTSVNSCPSWFSGSSNSWTSSRSTNRLDTAWFIVGTARYLNEYHVEPSDAVVRAVIEVSK